MKTVDRETVAMVPWGAGCRAWPLTEGADLSVKLEEMPPGTEEQRHRHARARQLFFVLSGALDLECDGALHRIGAEQALEVPPGVPHQACNPGPATARFLLISSPTTEGDRDVLPPPPSASSGENPA